MSNIGGVDGIFSRQKMCCEGILGTNSPLGKLHFLFALAFNKFNLCNFGRYDTGLQNRSLARRLLLSITDLILSFKAWHTRIKCNIHTHKDEHNA